MGNENYRNRTSLPNVRQDENVVDVFNKWIFNSAWITNEVDKSFVEFAEKAGKYMAENGLKSSKIRSIYSEIKRIQMNFTKEQSSFYLLKPKVAYAVGRERSVKGLQMFQCVFDKCFQYVNGEKEYMNFCNIMEAIIAYHKAFVKNDD